MSSQTRSEFGHRRSTATYSPPRRRITGVGLAALLVIGNLLVGTLGVNADPGNPTASDFLIFSRAQHGIFAEPTCDGSNDAQASVSGSNLRLHGRVHSNADFAAAGSDNVFNDAVTYGTHPGTCQSQAGTNTYLGGGPTNIDTAPTGLTDGWPGDLDSRLDNGLQFNSVEDVLPGHTCGAGTSLANASDLTLTAVHNGQIVCNGTGKVVLNASGANAANPLVISVTIISHGTIEISGQHVSLTPAVHGLLAWTDQDSSVADVSIKLAGSNYDIPEKSILFSPRSGQDISGSVGSSLCTQHIGQGIIKLQGSLAEFGPGTCVSIPDLVTQASGPVSVGEPITDTATLSGGVNPTGSITFKLYGPNDATCANAAIFTNVKTVNAGNGAYTSDPFSPTQPGTYRWIANYSGDANNAPTANGCNEANESSLVQPGDIKISKTADHAGPVNAGDQIGFTVKVWNAGTGSAAGVKLTDVLPTNPGLNWQIESQGAGWAGSCAIATGTLTCGGAAGKTVPGSTTEAATTFTVHITSTTTGATAGVCPGTGTVTNTGSVTTTNDGSGQASAFECVQAGDIKISKTADHAGPVNAGDQIGFTIKVWNTGAGSAVGVKLTDTLPTDPGTAWTIQNQGAGWAGTCAISLGILTCGGAAGVTVPGNTAQATTTFTVHIVSPTTAATAGTCPGTGEVPNTANVSTTNDGSGQASATECVNAGDIKISKTADHAGPVNAGDQIGFTIKVWNAGAGNATGVKLSDILPTDAGLNWTIQNQGAGWAGTCAIVTGTLTCGGAAGVTVPGNTLEGTTTFTVHIVSPTTAATAGLCPGTGEVDNTANVSTTNDGTGQASAEECVQAGDIKIAKSPDHQSSVNAGDQIGFTVKVWNTGAGTAVGTKLTDTLPTDPGTAWTIESQGAGWAGTCAISLGILTCGGAAGVTVPGNTAQATTTFTVHIVSPTTAATAGTCPGTGEVDNTANVSTTNDGTGQASAEECVQAGDIKILKTADHAAPVSAGDQIGFTLTVWNAGPGNLTGVKLLDTLPTDPGLNWTIQNQGAGWAGTCAIAAGSLTCGGAAGVTVPGNTTQGASTFTVHITSTTTGATAGPCPGTGEVNNTGSVSTTNDGTSQSTATECVLAGDIKIAKTPDHVSPVSAGDTIGFTLTVYNAGPGNATGVKLTDTLPVNPGLNWTIAGQGAGWAGTCAINTGVLTCGGAAGVTVAGNTTLAGSNFTVHITSTTTAATGGTCPAGTGTVTNTGSVSTTNDGSDDDTASECVQAPDIQIVKTADHAVPVSAGDPIGFTLTVYNTGAGNATGVKLNDVLPVNAGLNWTVAGQGAGWAGTCAIATGTLTCGGAAGVAVPGNLTQAASTFTVHITSTTTAATGGLCPGSGTVSNTGSVSTTNDGSDNSTATECVQAPDIEIVKTPDHAGSVSAGDTIGFTLTVYNTGAGNATGVKLNDVLPVNAGLNWTVAGQGAGWAGTCAIATGTLTCGGAAGVAVPGNLTQAASTFTVHITSTTTAATGGLCPGSGTVSNTGSVSTTNDGSDEATASECVQAGDIKIVKTADHLLPVSPGDQIGFTLTVWNTGAGNAAGVKLSDPLPTDPGLNWSIQSQGAGWAGTCAIAAGTLTCGGAAGVTVPGNTTAVASTYTVHIVSPTTAATGGTCPGTGEVSNTGSVSSTNDGSGQSTATECVQSVDIQIVKVADDASVVAGQPIGFSIKVFNIGTGNATGVKLTDTLPTDAGLNWTIQSQGAGWAGSCAIATGILTCGGAAGKTVNGNTTQAATTFTVHIVSPTTVATAGTSPVVNEACVASSNGGAGCADDEVDVFLLTLEKDNNAPDREIELPDGSTIVLPTQDEGKFVTYTLTYDVGSSAVHNAVLTDVLPAGVTYVTSPGATSNGTFTFAGYTAATRTLTWNAATVSADGFVEYTVKVDAGANAKPQPLVNHAAIESEETPEDTAQSEFFVPPPPQIETKVVTGPPTDNIVTGEGTTKGSSLLIVLAALGLIVIAVSFVTPVPATIRRRNRR